MKKKYSRILGVALSLMLVASLFGFAVPVSADNVAWSTISNPSALPTSMNLADVEVGPIAVTPDGGTLFAPIITETPIAGVGEGNADGDGDGVIEPFALVQSTDGGYTWTVTGLVNQAGIIMGVAVSPNFATDGTMYVASGNTVFRSIDSGLTFIALKPLADSTGTAIAAINSIDMWAGTPAYVMVGTNRDVLVLRDSVFEDWRDQEFVAPPGITNVLTVGFAPDFATTNFIWAVTDLGFVSATNSPGAWGTILATTPGLVQTATLTWTAGIGVVTMTAGPNGATVTYTALAGVVGSVASPVVLGAGATVTLTAAGAVTGTQTVAVTTGSATIGIAATGGTITSSVTGLGAVNADIGFPEGYSSTTAPYLWVSLNTGASNAGGIWRVRGLPLPGPSQVVKQYGIVPTPVAQWDVRSIAVSGTMSGATILGGLQDAATIVKSLNGGITWPPVVFKQPTGTGAVFVVMAPDFATSNVAYLGTSDGLNVESAFQVSSDGGMSWSQTGLIDTPFAVINDIAVVSLDTIFVVTDNFSLWKIANASARTRTWERILTANTVTLPGNVLANIALVVTSPDFLTDGVVYTTDNATGIMKAIDGGSIFAPMGPPAGAISVLHVLDATFAFIGSVNQVYRTDDGGYSWLAATTGPAGTVTDIAFAPNYATSGHILTGGTSMGPGGVYMSKDGGATFAVPAGPPPVALGGGAKYVAFEPTYTGAGHPGPATYGFYAASGTTIMRWYAAGVFWETIDVGPTGTVAGLPVAADAFTITGAGADVGTITVLTGSVTVTPTATATIAGVVTPGTLTITAGMGAIAFTLPVAVDTLVVTALTDGTSGTFTIGAATTTAAITSDVVGGGVATCGVGGAAGTYPFSLPDDVVPAVAGAAASAINGLLTSPDGTIYGCNALAGQGVERSLNPTASAISAFATGPVEGETAPVFERMNQTLAATATLMALQLVVDDTLAVDGSKNVLFAIDTTGAMGVDAIRTYTDTLATKVVAISPEDGAIFPRVEDVTLEWETLTGALSYRFEIARDDAFRIVVVAGDNFYPIARVTGLMAGQTYFWRVRVDEAPAGAPGLPLLSRWSETRSFVTELGGRIWHPFVPIAGVAPGPGAQDVLTKPVFQWNGADWATSYELMLADNAAFTGATTKTLTTTSWVSDTDLGYSTTWYWKVRALSAASESEWSDVGVFTIKAEPVEATPPVVIQEVPDIIVEVPPVEVPPAVEATPTWALLVIIIIGAVLVVSVIVLILRTRRPI